MKSNKLRLIKERMIRYAQSQGQPETTIAADLQALQVWEGELLAYASRVKGIKANQDLTRQGQAKQIEAETNQMLKRLAGEEATAQAIAQGVQAINGSITTEIAKALGKNRVMDATAMLLDHLQEQEVRQLWRHQQAQAEAAHALKLKQAKDHKWLLSDQERESPDVVKATFLGACQGFKVEDADAQAVNRLLVTAVLKSPVPILDRETVDQGMELLKANVCEQQLKDREAAICRAACAGTMLRGLEDVIRNPDAISAFEAQHVPVSDQDKLAA